MRAKAPCTAQHGLWPTCTRPPPGDASADLLAHAGEALAALRGIKSKAKVSMKTPILSVTLAVADDVRGSIEAALGDIAEAGRVTGPIAFTAPAAAEGEDEAADVTVAESELGEPPGQETEEVSL